ncbi:ZIP family metal transporter [Dethiobacter alkaliphilus]|uniref:ZIP family metal transporter n=1 Tax=Dethiobacter alkaliphilus TaxID=427926 RepID=UPI002225BCE6|nr:ZIP family metal transporter [Dethiobacter alkaliphilus]MCW3490557.1 ZIP family metal transporter [Dethiobacter alkaliphilus]
MYETLLISTMAGLATGLGGLIVACFGKPSVKALSLILGIAAGINIVIATVELLPAAVEHGNLFLMSAGFVFGIAIMSLIDRAIPNVNLLNGDRAGLDSARLIRVGILIAVALAVHNLPEGLAIGAGFEATHSLGAIIALAIGLHNIPEGMGAAAPLKMGGMDNKRIVLITSLAGLATPLGTFIGMLLMRLSAAFVSLSLAFGGGAIMYVVCKELIPESQRQHAQYAIYGMTLGFLITLILIFGEII